MNLRNHVRSETGLKLSSFFHQDYPIPGSYHIRDFIEKMGLNPVPRTYCAKGPERNTLMSTVRRGDVLLPGAYNFTDSTNEALRCQETCSFKRCPRPDIHTLGLRDKTRDVPISGTESQLFPGGTSTWTLQPKAKHRHCSHFLL
ncbi:protein STPG4-like [Cyprinus carpio]|uniref:Protein STPG4-like n=1 Tax=Cyprinus carpio TaxID=7962 RepID=A0A9R0AB89_CYPCA|nr:protein STPG4-like [Cyprinus carpio]